MLVEWATEPPPALLDREEEEPNDFKELIVDLNSFEAVPVEFEERLLEADDVLGSGGSLPMYRSQHSRRMVYVASQYCFR